MAKFKLERLISASGEADAGDSVENRLNFKGLIIEVVR